MTQLTRQLLRIAARMTALLLLSGILVTMASTDALADEKLLHGTACDGDADYIIPTYDGVYNLHSTVRFLAYCPIVREDFVDDDIDEAWVYIEDHHSTQNFSCYLTIMDGNGSFTSDLQYNSGTGVDVLNWSTGLSSSYGTDASYLLRCYIPAYDSTASELISYKWDET